MKTREQKKKNCRCKFQLSIFHVHASHLIVLLMLALSIPEIGTEKIQKAILRKTRKAIKQPWLTSFDAFPKNWRLLVPAASVQIVCLLARLSSPSRHVWDWRDWAVVVFIVLTILRSRCVWNFHCHIQCSRHSAWRRRTTTLVCTHEYFRHWDWIMHANLDLLFLIENP